ncbi:MAG: hypothetical protein EAZ51_03945 [Sphingobacteriales bacterium]|nr:MAG: hypothetical protein EAZ64_06605 [Sphingobacteriales bacterium]TAF81628.1 MAG: hypothetical protein EAZ51_03945 [Sphingobacteriales bacterium]
MTKKLIATFLKKRNKTIRISLIAILFLIQNLSSYAACDPKLDPFCDDVNEAPLGPEDCDPNLDPYCEDVNVPLDSGIFVVFSFTLIIGVYLLQKSDFQLKKNIA